GGDHVVVGQAVDEQQRAFQLGRVGQQGAAAVGVGVGGRVAQVAFAVVGVVQAPVGHRGAGHGGVEDVGAAQHGQGGQVAPARPAAGGHPAEVELGVVGAHGAQRLHLVVQDGTGQVAPDRPLPGRAPARGAAAVGDQDGEALVGEPLGDQEPVAGGQHLAVVGAAAGGEQHRQEAGGGRGAAGGGAGAAGGGGGGGGGRGGAPGIRSGSGGSSGRSRAQRSWR